MSNLLIRLIEENHIAFFALAAFIARPQAVAQIGA